MTYRLALAVVALLAASAAPSHASVSYHLVTAQPPGVGLYAQVVFNDPPASATAPWSVVLPSGVPPDDPIASLSVFNIRDIPGIIPLPIYEFTAANSSAVNGTVGSTTGANLVGTGVQGYATMFATDAVGHLQGFQLSFNPDGTGRVTVMYITGRDTANFLIMDGTWVLGDAPPPVPEPSGLVLGGIALVVMGAAIGVRWVVAA